MSRSPCPGMFRKCRLQERRSILIERRVRDLHEKDPVARYAADRIRIDLPRQGVEEIKDQADRRMIGAPHDLPGVAVIGHVPPQANAS